MSPGCSRDRFLGCLLGLALGDAIGAPFEGLPADYIYWDYGLTTQIFDQPPEDTLRYTDDTQMTIAVAETLLEHGEIEEQVLGKCFVANYDPLRGYGPGARQILEAMATDGDWRGLRQNLFPGGSLGNGAAMRVAPIGLLFCDDLDVVMEQARLSALPTHLHPLGIEGAQLLAVAIALVVREQQFNRKGFYRELLARVQSEEFRWHLSVAARLRVGDPVSTLGNSLEAHRSVATAIACFTISPSSYESVIAQAIGLGNDTDTLAAMAGALSGAHLGIGGLPTAFLDRLENERKGRRHLEHLANGLYDLYSSRHQG